MVKRVFRIVSSSERLLTADAIAEALLKQFTLSMPEQNNFFAVAECSKRSSSRSRRKR